MLRSGSENFCQDGVVKWGEGQAAENKDQLKFELIKIRLKNADFKDNNFKGCRHFTILAAKVPNNLDIFSPSYNPTVTVLRNLCHLHVSVYLTSLSAIYFLVFSFYLIHYLFNHYKRIID